MPNNPVLQNIEDCVTEIRNAVFGEEVRSALIKAIELCHNDVYDYVTSNVLQGASITNINIDQDGELTITIYDPKTDSESVRNLGNIKGPKGDKGDRGDASGGDGIIVDGSMDANSGNPVANSTLVSEFSKKMDKKPFASVSDNYIYRVLMVSQTKGIAVSSKKIGSSSFNQDSNQSASLLATEAGVKNYSYPKNETYNRTDMDNRYAQNVNVYNKTASDQRYVQISNVSNELNAVSEHPVQTKVVHEAIQNLTNDLNRKPDRSDILTEIGLTTFTVCNLDLYDATLENADDNVILFLFGYDNNNSPTCGLDKLTEDDYGKVWHIVLTFTKADLVPINSVTVQEHRRGQPMPDALQHYDNVAQGDVIRFDYTMSDSTASILRLRLNARTGEQKVHVLITSNRQLDDVLDTKANVADVDTALAAKANAADVDYKYGDTSEPVYVEPEALLVNNWVLNINGVPTVYNASATSVLIADVTGGETVKITARPFKTNYYYSFFDDNISFDSSVTNGGFTSDHLIGGARGTSTETHELFENVTVQVPANAKKIVVSVFGSAYTPRLYKAEYRRKRKWLGKKWCAVGDSITEVNGSASKKYLEYIAEQTGIEAVNMGKSGTGYKRKQDVNEAFYQRIGSVPTDSDVVTIFGSFNDAPYIFGDCLTQSTAPVTFPDTEEGAEAAAAEAARISWIPYKTINKHGEIVDVESTNPGGGKYAVTNAIPVRADRSYYIKTKMKYDRAFFVFKDGNGDNSSIVYVKRLNPANNDGTSYEFKGIIKAPENAKYLYVSTAFYGESYNTFVKEDNVGTVNDTGTDTLAGCINTTIDNLYDIMPTVNLGIISSVPWGDYNPYTNAWANIYVDMLKEICQNRGIPFLDLYYESNLRPWEPAFRQAMYTRDNGHSTHPDENGHQLFAPRIEAFLDKLLLH